MFKATLKDSKIVKGIFEAVSLIISEAKIRVGPTTGMQMTAMDGSHICLVDLFISKDDLDGFECDEEYELGINVEDLVKIIKRANPNDIITLIYTADVKKIQILLKSEDSKKTRKFTISLYDIDNEEIDMNKINAMEFPNKCDLNIGIIDEAIKDAEIYSEILVVRVNKNLIFSTEGTLGDMEYVLDENELKKFNFTVKSEGNYAIQFLRNIVKIGSVSQNVSMSLDDKAPLKSVFKILKFSQIQYFLAPRVEEDVDSQYINEEESIPEVIESTEESTKSTKKK